ncbi:dihydrolipoamide acetyltransferase family protein [Variovorax sp. M-6]|uniref:dihydrolipoamide acetyltransferase family protein n=1 Tax=Variovorax sp. M-6 TaxID=3233041 RepID=UPI003F9512BD
MAGSIHVIKVPDVGEGTAEVELVAWHVRPGDAVVEDQGLADVMTDKAIVEIPSPVAGRVLALGGEVGQTLAVGAELIRIERAGDAEAPVAAPARAAPPPSPAAKLAATPPPYAGPARPAADRPIASPAVRRRAWELGVDLGGVVASGTAGRIVHADLDAHVAAHGTRPPDRAPGTGSAERNDQQAVPVIGLRRRIALQMQESKRRIPHFSYVEEVDVTEVEALRAALNTKWSAERGHLTLLPLLMRAMVLAVREFPQVNALFDDEAGVVTRHGAVHIGIATQTRHGLVVPVVRHAEARDLWAMAAELARLAEAARAGRATRAELSGSTITISSLGALGGIVSTPVINRPEVAIVAVNRIVERPVLRGGAVVSRRMMNLSSSFDHRVVDGMDAARFVQAMRATIEAPALLFVE